MSKFEDFDVVYEYLEDYELFTSDELRLICDMNGSDIKTLEDALYCRYGYRDMEQYLEYEDRETYRDWKSEEEDDEDEENE